MSQKETMVVKILPTTGLPNARLASSRPKSIQNAQSVQALESGEPRFGNLNTNRKRRSSVWKYFEAGTDVARCLVPECRQMVGSKRGSTKYLLSHLREFHQELYEEPAAKKPKEDRTNDMENKTLGLKAKCDNLLLDAVLIGNIPFNFLNRPIVRELFSTLSRGVYTVPDRRKLSGDLLDMRYNMAMSELRTELATGGFFAVSTDGWSSKTNVACLYAVVVYGINTRFERFQRAVALDDVSRKKHSGANLKEILNQTLERVGVDGDRIVAICTDGARNEQNMAGFYLEEYGNCIGKWLHCHCHNLQLMVKPSLALVGGQLKTLRKTFISIRRSRPAKSFFESACMEMEFPIRRVILDVSTRWSSTYELLLFFFEYYEALLITSQHFNLEMPDVVTINSLEKLMRYLKPFALLTKRFSSTEATITEILPSFVLLVKSLNKERSQKDLSKLELAILDSLTEQVNLRHEAAKENRLLHASIVFGPSFFRNPDYFTTEETIFQQQQLLDVYKDLFGNRKQSLPMVPLTPVKSSDNNDREEDPFDKAPITNHVTSFTMLQGIKLNKLQAELHELPGHMAARTLPAFRDICDFPFRFWREIFDLPVLKSLAAIFLVIPPASIENERVFSRAGQVYANTLRNLLTAKKAEKSIIVGFDVARRERMAMRKRCADSKYEELNFIEAEDQTKREEKEKNTATSDEDELSEPEVEPEDTVSFEF